MNNDTKYSDQNLPPLSQAERSYLKELAAEIAASGGLGDRTFEEALTEAHRARMAVHREIREGQTYRAKMARAAIASSVHTSARISALSERGEQALIDTCSEIYSSPAWI